MQPISPSEILENPDHYYIVDIRESYEFIVGNLGSKHIPMADVLERIQELPADKTVIFMCKSGKRASALVNLLVMEKGLKNLNYLEGGIEAWKEKVQPDLQVV